MNANHILGRYGEDRAAHYLADLGYEIVERNWRCNAGEIDLVARDKDRLVFVEVKTRNGQGFGHPFEAITADKVARMRKLVALWCKARQIGATKVRLDAVSVLVSSGRVNIEHIKQVF
jgi:putative endonuclease